MRAAVMSVVVLGLLGLSACQKMGGVQSKAAVKAAVEEHLKHQPGIFFQNMTLEVDSVTFHGDTAEALVKFHSKQAPGFAVGILYKLRKAGNAWQVESSSSVSMPGMTPHGNAPGNTPQEPANPAGPALQPSH